MGKKTDHISDKIKTFIEYQRLFFVGTAAEDGRVNISPKGCDSFRVVDKNKVVWLNLTGSGNETAAHLLKQDRMTIMFCAFERNPLILRLYGSAKCYHQRDSEYERYIDLFSKTPGNRQIITMQVDLVQTSCGFAVPFMDFKGERETLLDWAESKGETGIREYWKEKNKQSIDGFKTGIFEEDF